ncbi:MAG TPA: hypothetical protein VFB78_01630, partial [Acidimicrobiales bacterium]|nr:hypothetical protein [Acidimicrobiales bacterium]
MRGTVNVGGAATTAATRPAATANTTTATSTKRTTTTNRVATTRPSTSTVSSDEPTTGTEAVTSSTQRQLAIATKDTPSSGPPLAAPLVGAVTLVGLGYLAYRWRYPRTQ